MRYRIVRFIKYWIIFYWGIGFDISFELCGYFDSRPRIRLHLIFFNLCLIIPIWLKKWADDCDSPKWGIAIHGSKFWIHTGGKGNMNGGSKWWAFRIPFFYKEWVRTSNLRIDGNWEHETMGNSKKFYEDKWKSIIKHETFPYTYFLKDGTSQHRKATVKTEEREWRPYALMWTSYFAHISRTIDIQFDDEIGERTGSWKGGVTGCSYELLKGESPKECLYRMQLSREFN